MSGRTESVASLAPRPATAPGSFPGFWPPSPAPHPRSGEPAHAAGPRVGTRRRWTDPLARARTAILGAPATFGYLGVLAATTVVLHVESPGVDRLLLRQSSTNLDHLGRDPLRVLVTSALWVTPLSAFAVWTALFVAVVAPVERWLGTRRAVAVFAAGHVGATLVTAAGIWAGISAGVADPGLAGAEDVGVSYGFAAVAALLAFRLPQGWRIAYLGALVGYVGVSLALDPSFTDVGHAVALCLGLLAYPLVRGSAAAHRAPGRLA